MLKKIIIIIYLILLQLNIKADFFTISKEGYLQRTAPNKFYYMSLKLNPNENSTFFTSNFGRGYQAKLELSKDHPESEKIVKTKIKFDAIGTIECQKPLGNIVSCGSCTNCPSFPEKCYAQASYGNAFCSNSDLGFSFNFWSKEVKDIDPDSDFFNETANKQNLKYIFLDSIVNNSDSKFQIIVTDAPLLNDVVRDENTAFTEYKGLGSLISLINQTPDSLDKMIKAALEGKGKEKQEGAFSVKLLGGIAPGGEDFTIGKETRRHMAQKNLAIKNTDDSVDPKYQTIILAPVNSCQPAILIGRDSENNICAVTVFTTIGNCDLKNASGKEIDRLYFLKKQITPTAISNEVSGRIKIVINPTELLPEYKDNKPTGKFFGQVSKIEVLKKFMVAR